MNTMKIESMQEIYLQARKLIINHIEAANEDDIFTIREGYGFGEFENQSPTDLNGLKLAESFECFMHIFDFLDETTCQDEEFFKVKDLIEDFFFVDAVNVA